MIALALPLALLLAGALAAPPPGAAPDDHASLPPAPSTVDFGRDIRPLLARRCFVCHGPDESTRKAGLRLDTRDRATTPRRNGPAIVPGDADASRLVARISAGDPEDRMPPEGPGLTRAQIDMIRRWIEGGAPYQPHWSLRPIRAGDPPEVDDTAWPADDLDRFILARLEQADLAPAPPASPRDLVRRLWFDLVGLPPPAETVQAVADDPSDAAYGQLVDELLASPHFGERWGRHWLDLVRYAETYGHEFDYPIRHAWQYRDYVIRAFNADVPYDEFVTEQIAGDLVASPRRHPVTGTNESILGTGFWLLTQGTHGPVDVRQDEADRIENQIDVFSKTFLATTVACARCHDHKFDAVTTKDYYALAGFLQSSRRGEAYLGAAIAPAIEKVVPLAAEAAAWLDAAREDLGSAQDVMHWLPPIAEGEDDPLARWRRPEAVVDPSSSSTAAVMFEFAAGAGHGWFANGHAFGETTTNSGDFIDVGDTLAVAPAGVVHSARVARTLHGTLRSPTFALTTPDLWYHVAGTGGVLRLIVDGFVLDEFNALLFSNHRMPIDEPAWTWRHVDVRKYVGHRAHIELIDEGPGFVALAAVVATAEDVSPAASHAGALEEAVATALATWREGIVAPGESDLINTLLRLRGSGQKAEDETPSVAAFLARFKEMTHAIPSPEKALALADGTGEDEYVFLRGDHRHPGPVVPRRFVEALGGPDQPAIERGSGRLELAERVLDHANPFPARVWANRVVHHLLGRGIVPTTDDFGALGEMPTHPELLDHLAHWLRDDGAWSTKALIRRIVMSRTYRMASTTADPDRAERIDPANALWHRMPVRRLDAESIRDAMLVVAGRLDDTVGGPSVPIHLTPFMSGRGRPGASGPVDGAGRRSVYLMVRRNFLVPMLTAFDFPVPASTMGRRRVSNVPAQSLTLMNDPFVAEMARSWAERVTTETPDATARIARMFEAAFARPPTDDERMACLAFVEDQTEARDGDEAAAWADLAGALFASKSFIFLR